MLETLRSKHVAALGAIAAIGLVIGIGSRVSHATALPVEAAAKTSVSVADVHLIDAVAEGGWHTMLANRIKTANQKDLFLNVSLESGLMTRTVASSKGGNKSTATAEAEVRVRCLINGEVAYPGEVVFNRRVQQLSATFQGIIEGCLSVDEESGSVIIDEECVEPEEIELLLNTMSANSFNFIYPDCSSGVHTFEVQCRITNTSNAGETSTAEAYATVGKGVVTVEEMRLAQGAEIMMN